MSRLFSFHPICVIFALVLLLCQSAYSVTGRIGDDPKVWVGENANLTKIDTLSPSLYKSVDVVLVDRALQDQELLKEASKTAGLYFAFDSTEDSAAAVLNRITSWAAQTHQTIDSVSILSHGDDGVFQLGFDKVTSDSIISHLGPWQNLATVLAKDANIYIYSCETGKGSVGQTLLDTIASVMGVDVFAAKTITGNGSDWKLNAASTNSLVELHDGLQTPLNEQLLTNYSGTLADTGYNYATTDVNSRWNDPEKVFAEDNKQASGTFLRLQEYADFNFDIPSGKRITGITISTEAKLATFVGWANLEYEMSWDAGATWTDKQTATWPCLVWIFCFFEEHIKGDRTDTWGREWAISDFSNTNFRLQILGGGVGVGADLWVDYIRIKVHYESLSAANTTITTSSPSVKADGTAFTTITVQAKDSAGDNFVVGGSNVVLAQNGNASISAITDNNDGTYTATVSNATPEAIAITGTIDGETIGDTAAVTFFYKGPGGAANNLVLWLDADLGVTGTTAITQWDDQSGNGKNVTQLNAQNQPSLNEASSALNFHSSIEFDGNRDFLSTSGVLSSVTDDMTVFIVTEIDKSSGEYNKFFGMGTDLYYPHVGFSKTEQSFIFDGAFHIFSENEPMRYDETLIYTTDMTYPGSDAPSHLYINGIVNSTSPTTGVTHEGTGAFAIGGSLVNGEDIDGRIAEFIMYNTVLSTTNRQQVESYLAIKYGVTLTNDYLDSNATPNTVFNLDGVYVNDIIALSKDAKANLDQRISKSINNGSVLTLSTDTNFSSENSTHNDTLTEDGYLVIGHDGSSITSTQTNDLHSDFIRRSPREWKVQRTETVGSVNMSFTTLPTLNAFETYVLIEDTDGDFSNGHSVLATSTSNVFQGVNFSSGTNYFTVAIVGIASLGDTAISVSSPSITTDGGATAIITVQAKDASGTDLTTGGLSIALDQNGSATISMVTDNNNGTYTATISDSVSETITISATLDGNPIVDTAAITFIPGAADASSSTLAVSTTTVTTDSSTTATITVQVKDAQGNNVTSGGSAVVISSNGSASIGSILDNGDGTYTATISNTLAEAISISATVDGSTITETPAVTFEPGLVSTAQSTLSVSSPSVIADGITTSTITLQTIDAQGNNLLTGGSSIALSQNGSASISAITDNNDGTYTASITNTSIEVITVSGTIAGNPITDTATITFLNSAPGGVSSNLKLWLDAGNEVFGTTAITQWNDQSGNNKHVTQTIADYQPSLNAASSLMNFHPSIELDGDRDHMVANAVANLSFEDLSFFIVMEADQSSGTDNKIFDMRTAGGLDAPHVGFYSTNQIFYDDDETYNFNTAQPMRYSEPLIFGGDIDYSVNTTSRNYLNGFQNPDSPANILDSGHGIADFNIGGSTDTNQDLDGRIAEVIIFQSLLGTTDRHKIDTYLAVKYGLSLTNDYIDSSAAEVYDIDTDTTYNNDVFGIAKDVTANLDQRISRSWNDSSGLVLSTDTDYTSKNSTHIDTIANNSYLLIGHNGGGTFITQTTDIDATFERRTVREWKVQNTGLVGNVNMSFTTLPTLSANESYALIEDNDGDFSSGYSVLATSPNTAFEDVNFSAGTHYFTIAVITASTLESTISVSATTVTTDGGATATITIQTKDSSGADISWGGLTIALNNTGTAVIGAITDNNDGTYSASISDIIAESITISASIGGSPMSDTANVTFTAGAVSTAITSISASPTTVTADGATATTITVQTKDTQGNNLTSGGLSVVLTESGNALIGAINDIGDGTYTATLTNTVAEIVTVSGSIASMPIATTTDITFTPNNPSATQSSITTSPVIVAADGVTTSTITVQTKDASGNNLTSGGLTVALTENGSATISSVTDNGDGTYSATITNTTVEVISVGGTLNGSAISNTSLVTFIVGTASPINSTLATSSSVIADGVSNGTITLQAIDSQNNNVTTGGATVSFSHNGSATIGSVIDNGNGTYTATVISTTTETITINAILNGNAVTDTAQLTFIPSQPSELQSTINSPGVSVTADGFSSAIISIQVKDALGNNIMTGGDSIVISSTGSAVIGSITDNNNGTYTVNATNTVTENITISGTLNGAVITDTATVDFIGGNTASVIETQITALPNTLTADGTSVSTITVRAKDSLGNNLVSGGLNINLTNSGSATISAITDVGDGSYTATMTSTVAEIITISGTINTVAIKDTAAVTFNPGVASATQTTISSSLTTVLADGIATSTIMVQVKDNQGSNQTSGGETVLLTESGNAVISPITDNGDGTYSATITNTTIEPITINGTLNGNPIADFENINFTSGVLSPTNTTITTSAAIATTGRADAALLTVRTYDTIGFPLSSGGNVIVLISDGNAVIGPISDNADGSYSATISNLTAESNTITAAINGIFTNTNVTILFVNGGPAQINESDGRFVNGTAPPGSFITVTDTLGNILCTTVADITTGNYHCVTSKTKPNGDNLMVIATDPAGNSETSIVKINSVDIDDDGISDLIEMLITGNSITAIQPHTDSDGDRLPDYAEVILNSDFLLIHSPVLDGNMDSDRDGISDAVEYYFSNTGGDFDSQLTTDTDNDGIPDITELSFPKSNFNDENLPLFDGTSDLDGDNVTNAVEYYLSLLSISNVDDVSDYDNDGYGDALEVRIGSSPLRANDSDIDKDGVNDAIEAYLTGSINGIGNTATLDRDLDGLPDIFEISLSTDLSDPYDNINDALDGDIDGDGLTDAIEIYLTGDATSMSPTQDSDGDGVADGIEISWGSDPLSHSKPTVWISTADLGGGFVELIANHGGYQAPYPTFSWDISKILIAEPSAVGGSTNNRILSISDLSPGPYSITLTINITVDQQTFSSTISHVFNVTSSGVSDSDYDGVSDVFDTFDGMMGSEEILNTAIGGNETYKIQTQYGVGVRAGMISRMGANEVGTISNSQLVSYINPELPFYDGNTEPNNNILSTPNLFDVDIVNIQNPGDTVAIVIPLNRRFLSNAAVVLFDRASYKWTFFDASTTDNVSSTAGSPGNCPPPGDASYSPGLTAGNYCLQLNITDGGPNDHEMTTTNTENAGSGNDTVNGNIPLLVGIGTNNEFTQDPQPNSSLSTADPEYEGENRPNSTEIDFTTNNGVEHDNNTGGSISPVTLLFLLFTSCFLFLKDGRRTKKTI